MGLANAGLIGAVEIHPTDHNIVFVAAMGNAFAPNDDRGVYRTKDDKYLSVGALEPKFWSAFNAAVGREGNMAEVVAPPKVQEEIRQELAGLIAAKTRDEWTIILADFDCCTEPVLELSELQDHPLHKEREVFFTVPCEGGWL